MEMVVDVYDSVEAILLSALISVGMAIIIGIEIFLYDFIIRLASGNGGNLCGKAFDLENHVTFGILMAGAARLAVNLIQEIYTAISFFIESTNVSLSEIIYLTVSFILHILFWPATHALLCFIKNREIKRL